MSMTRLRVRTSAMAVGESRAKWVAIVMVPPWAKPSTGASAPVGRTLTGAPTRADNSRVARALRGTVAVITGASSGIGAATAVACGREGMKVALAARRADRLAEVARAVRAAGGEARVVPTDVVDEAAVRALVEETAKAWGRLDVVVANAGIGLLAPAAETTAAEFEQIMRVNFLGVVYAVLAALPH